MANEEKSLDALMKKLARRLGPPPDWDAISPGRPMTAEESRAYSKRQRPSLRKAVKAMKRIRKGKRRAGMKAAQAAQAAARKAKPGIVRQMAGSKPGRVRMVEAMGGGWVTQQEAYRRAGPGVGTSVMFRALATGHVERRANPEWSGLRQQGNTRDGVCDPRWLYRVTAKGRLEAALWVPGEPVGLFGYGQDAKAASDLGRAARYGSGPGVVQEEAQRGGQHQDGQGEQEGV